ncbi:hypothetical protein, partial [Desulfothermus okinawensis]
MSEIKKRGYEYIVGYRFKNTKIEDLVLDKEGYQVIDYSEEEGLYAYKETEIKEKKKVKEKSQYKEIELNHKLVLTYSDKRALKDKKD